MALAATRSNFVVELRKAQKAPETVSKLFSERQRHVRVSMQMHVDIPGELLFRPR